MTITLERFITFIACCASLVAMWKAYSEAQKAKKKEIEDKTAERTETRSNLTHIREGVDEIKKTQVKQIEESRELCDRVTRCEGKADEALRRIEAHERRGDA